MKNTILFVVLTLTGSFWVGYFWAKHIDTEPVFPLTDERTLHEMEAPPICEEDINPFTSGSWMNVIHCPDKFRFTVPSGSFVVSRKKCLEIKDCKKQNSHKLKRRTNVGTDSSNR